jgi:hypothetical protein
MSFTKYQKLIFLIFYLFILSSCKSQIKPDCLISLEEKLSPKVNEKNKIGEIINLKDSVNCFEWDSLIVMPVIYLIENSEKELGLKLPLQYNHLWTHESETILLFVKGNEVEHYILQYSRVKKETFESASTIKTYNFLSLVKSYGNDGYYVKIPREKAVFVTYPMIYHDKNGKELTNPKYGLEVRVK